MTILALLAGTGACSSEPVDPCQIQPTKTNQAGQWVEWDDEAIDADPCDSDDLDEAGHKKPTVKKPAKKPTPGKKGFK